MKQIQTAALDTPEYEVKQSTSYSPRIKPDQVRLLWLLKKKTGRPMTELVREALAQYLRNHQDVNKPNGRSQHDKVTQPGKAVEKAKTLIVDWHKEHLVGLYLNARHVATRIELISIGILDQTVIHPRETFRPALVNHAKSVIILHNHPTGEVMPSNDDLAVTKRLGKAGEILGIALLDHIIFTQDDYYSFRQHGLI